MLYEVITGCIALFFPKPDGFEHEVEIAVQFSKFVVAIMGLRCCKILLYGNLRDGFGQTQDGSRYMALKTPAKKQGQQQGQRKRQYGTVPQFNIQSVQTGFLLQVYPANEFLSPGNRQIDIRITSYNVCYTKLLRTPDPGDPCAIPSG